MKIDKKQILWGLIFVVGLSIFLYPIISNLWNQNRASKLVSNYAETIKSGEAKNYDQEKEKVKAYNKELLKENVPTVFAERQNKTDANYEGLLNVNGTGMIGYVEIPSIKVQLPIYHYTTEEVLLQNVGHLFGSSLPMGGKGTHVAISAHRGLPSAKLFTDLNLLQKEDYFFLYILDEVLVYQVDQIKVVDPHETELLAIDPEQDYVTMFTCTPYGVNTQRLLVRGHRTQMPSEGDVDRLKQSITARPNTLHLLSQIGIMILGTALAGLVILIVEKIRKRRSHE